jgi:hypothetical protein
VYVLGGCLERAVKRFRQTFDVYSSPDKLSFAGFSGAPYSFDLSGVYDGVEAFVECKGYRDGSGILDGYREFLAKAYCTSVQAIRHKRDLFWFATNVPFGSSFGRRLCTPEFVRDSLTGSRPAGAAPVLAGASVDEGHVRSLSRRIAVAIFTDSFVRVMGTLYRFRPGDTLWSATKLIHGGRIPLPQFEPIVANVRYMNNLDDPNRIRSGQRLHLPWFGMRDEDDV